MIPFEFIGGFVCGFCFCFWFMLIYLKRVASTFKVVVGDKNESGSKKNSEGISSKRFFKGWKL